MQNPQNNANPGEQKSKRVVSKIIGDCDQLSELVRNGSAHYLQLGRGRVDGLMSRLDLNSLTFLRAICTNHTLCHGTGDTQHTYSLIPMRWKGDLKWNGRVLDRPSIFHWDSEVEYFRVGRDIDIVALIFDRAAFAPAFTDWTGGITADINGFSGESGPATLPPAVMQGLQKIISITAEDPDAFLGPQFRESVEHSMRQALFHTLWKSEPAGHASRSLRNYRRIVRHADEYLHSRVGQPVYLLDLCHATGTSARTLEMAFRAMCDVTPMQYLKLRRLRMTRCLLRNASATETMVKSIAYEAGFWELGRFAVDYRKQFGETPVKTLASPPSRVV
jgi:AraC-like DNA-binding protein